jgi:hypothetical protein
MTCRLSIVKEVVFQTDRKDISTESEIAKEDSYATEANQYIGKRPKSICQRRALGVRILVIQGICLQEKALQVPKTGP